VFSCLDDGPVTSRRAAWFRRLFALSTLALLAVTWRLWTPQTVYPQVPLFVWAGRLPPTLEWAAIATLTAMLGFVVLAPQRRLAWKLVLLLLVVPLGGLLLVDQHRLQPWAYEALIVAIVLSCASRQRAFVPLRLLVISIYFYSAVSKLDATFAHTVGQQFLAALSGLFGVSIRAWPSAVRVALALCFPLVELAVAVGLCVGPLRQWAVGLAVVMHATLIVILGPWGLNHHGGVLIWNGWFIAQALLLFAAPRPTARSALSTSDFAGNPLPPERRLPARVAWATVAMAVLLPLLEPLGWYDHCLAWGLYAPGNSRVAVLLDRAVVDRLPEGLKRHVTDPDRQGLWVELKIDRWSLAALDAPIYPQARYQLGVAEAVGRRFALGDQIRAILYGPAARLSGRRRKDVLAGLGQIEAAANRFWLSAHPRGRFDPAPENSRILGDPSEVDSPVNTGPS